LEDMDTSEENKLKKLIVVGDRVLIKPKKASDRTDSGLYLPPGVHEREKIQSGYIMKTGPGYPIPIPAEEDEPWKESEEKTKYIPLQAKVGDLAIFLQKSAFDVIYGGEKYFIVPQSAILMLEREEDLI
jgi:chaperonin GroES